MIFSRPKRKKYDPIVEFYRINSQPGLKLHYVFDTEEEAKSFFDEIKQLAEKVNSKMLAEKINFIDPK